jgi:putative Holliday junction resolvase
MPEAPDADARSLPQILLAVDFGLRRIGLAVGDTITGRARPLATLRVPPGREPGEPEYARIEQELRASGARQLIVGCPYNPDGSVHALAARTRAFAATLQARCRLPVHLVDERYSSIEATAALRDRRTEGSRRGRLDKESIDSAAAAVILERWMSGEGER